MKKVLVIDDAVEVAEVVQATLQQYGFAPIIALDGQTGLDLAREQRPDVILCDIQMPGLDGYGTLRALRASELTATTPFIFLSGMAERPDVRRGMELGADDYLTKPFTPMELMAAVRTQLAKKEEFERRTEQRLEEVRGNITLALPHELRTPLTGILGLATILMEEHQTIAPKEILETARDLLGSARRLQRLVENFLIYAQLELLKGDSTPLRRAAAVARTPTGSIVASTARQMARQARREQDLSCEVTPCPAPVILENLEKIVEELVGNAFKFSEPGSRVEVETHVADDTFVLTVTDHGRGMTLDQIACIGPHVQFDRRIYEQQGSGLGLIIAKRLTEMQGGQWTIESTAGRQTVVRVAFPLVPSAESGDGVV